MADYQQSPKGSKNCETNSALPIDDSHSSQQKSKTNPKLLDPRSTPYFKGTKMKHVNSQQVSWPQKLLDDTTNDTVTAVGLPVGSVGSPFRGSLTAAAAEAKEAAAPGRPLSRSAEQWTQWCSCCACCTTSSRLRGIFWENITILDHFKALKSMGEYGRKLYPRFCRRHQPIQKGNSGTLLGRRLTDTDLGWHCVARQLLTTTNYFKAFQVIYEDFTQNG